MNSKELAEFILDKFKEFKFEEDFVYWLIEFLEECVEKGNLEIDTNVS